MNGTTKPARLQANVVNTTLQIESLQQQLRDIDLQAITIATYNEIAFEQLDDDGSKDPGVARMIARLDALLRAVSRAAEVIQQQAESAAHLIYQIERAAGGAQ